MAQSPKSVLIIELNEFNVTLLEAAISQHNLPSLAKVLSFTKSNYKTQDRYNSGYLEPWVQWVSIHAGQSAQKHQIKHLGDVPDLTFTQCWETLSQAQITSGVWGVMNGARRNAEHNQFFLPDPWTFSETAYPPKLNALLALPRYVSKNYQHLNKLKLIKEGFKLGKFILQSKAASKIIRQTFTLLKDIRHFGAKHFVMISYFDVISTILFAEYKKKFKPQCTLLFLNSLAHLQHHYWHAGPTTITPELLHGLKKIDLLLGYLFASFPEDAIVMHNGLSQMNTNHEKPWVLYRQKDPLNFLHALQLQPTQVEQHMTHDGHAFFATEQAREHAFVLLKGARLDNKALFHVEKNPNENNKLFYQLNYTDDLCASQSIEFSVGDQKYRFFDYFDKIVTRTGRHIPIGTIYSNTIVFPDQIYNHNFNTYLYHYLQPEHFALRENIEKTLFTEALEV